MSAHYRNISRPRQHFPSGHLRLDPKLLPERILCLPYFQYRCRHHTKICFLSTNRDSLDGDNSEFSKSHINLNNGSFSKINETGKSSNSSKRLHCLNNKFQSLLKTLTSYYGVIMILINYCRFQQKDFLRLFHHYYQLNYNHDYHNNHYYSDHHHHQQQQQHHMRNYHGQRRLPYNFMHCTFCALYCNGYLELQEYAKEQEVKHRKKIILPSVIPWEYGSNKYASQKGTGGFGTIRNATTTIKSSRQLSESNDGVVPWMNCPQLRDKELASQAGLTPFGGIREHAIKVLDKDCDRKKDISKIVADRSSESILKIWSQPNPEAKNDQPFGKHRDAIMEVRGGRRFSQKELNASRAAIPKFQDPRETIAARAQKAGEARATGIINNRQTVTQIEGLNRTEEDVLDSNRYMAWIGGQLTLQSQSYTGGFNKPRDVVSTSYFDRVMSEREFLARKASRLEKLRQELTKKSKDEETVGETASEINELATKRKEFKKEICRTNCDKNDNNINEQQGNNIANGDIVDCMNMREN